MIGNTPPGQYHFIEGKAMHYRLEVKGYGIKVPELELGKSKIHIR